MSDETPAAETGTTNEGAATPPAEPAQESATQTPTEVPIPEGMKLIAIDDWQSTNRDRDAAKAEVTQLRGELEAANEKIKQAPADVEAARAAERREAHLFVLRSEASDSELLELAYDNAVKSGALEDGPQDVAGAFAQMHKHLNEKHPHLFKKAESAKAGETKPQTGLYMPGEGGGRKDRIRDGYLKNGVDLPPGWS